ncbi:MAG TPA: class I SAM-dependent methyltransferase [Nocardioides sp.]|nr:class I SAM-dependent methyltransferase [Nocardioides sp.]
MRALLRRLPGHAIWRLLRMWCAGGEQREAAVALVLRPPNLFQPFTTTARDRYPEELACMRDALAHLPPDGLRLLSFGCASGEELLTLHEQFPEARITGIDVNPLALRAARRRINEAAAGHLVSLVRAGDAEGEPEAAYDAVLAFAVLRHGGLNDAPPTCTAMLRFADFERTVTGLCRAVRPGGIFAIRHANFRFTDCAVAAGFEPVRTGFPSVSAIGPTPVYGRHDELLDVALRDDGLYRRRA